MALLFTVVMVSWVFPCIRNDQIIYFKYVDSLYANYTSMKLSLKYINGKI